LQRLKEDFNLRKRMVSQEDQILDLKRRALALKEAGDNNGAMVLLAQARDLEFENATVEDLWEPLKLKQLAVVLKKKGDLEMAKLALLKSKQIEKDDVESVRQQHRYLQQQQQRQEPEPDTNTALKKDQEIPPPPPPPPDFSDELAVEASGLPPSYNQVTDTLIPPPLPPPPPPPPAAAAAAAAVAASLLAYPAGDVEPPTLVEVPTDKPQNVELKSASAEPSQKVNDTPSTERTLEREPEPILAEETELNNDDGGGGDDDDDNDEECGADELTELMHLDDDDNSSSSSSSSNQVDALLEAVTFTIDEMLDEDMMTEFKVGGMPVPSDDEYQAKILECKKAALANKKAGDTTKALQELQKSKQLEKVRVALSQLQDAVVSEEEVALVNDMDMTNEDDGLLGELMDNKAESGVGSEFDEAASTSLETSLEELADFMDDPALLMDAMDMGMTVPTVDEVRAKAEEARQVAIDNKKAGDIEGAKAALVKCKKLTAQASKLETVLAQIEQKKGKGVGAPKAVSMGDLEALVESEENKSFKSPPKTEAEKSAAPAVKSAEELKQEAIKLRDAKQIKEAAEVLKLYKEALKRESQEAELKKRQSIIQAIQKEIELCKKQVRIFEFYERFVDSEAQQVSAWKKHLARCLNVIKIIQVKGSEAVKISRQQGDLKCAKVEGQDEAEINDIVKRLIETGSNSGPDDERLEICIIDAQQLQENTHLQKFVKQRKRDNLPQYPTTIRLDVHVQLPPNAQESEKTIDLVYDSSEDPLKNLKLNSEDEANSVPTFFDIQQSQYVELTRDDSAYGKILRRRIERNKKIIITAYSVPVAPNNKGGWFWSKKKSKDDEELPAPVLLGKIVVEMEGLMRNKCIAAGEFPFMSGSGSKSLGGMLRLAIRTGVPIQDPKQAAVADPSDEAENEASAATIVPHMAMTFSLETGPATAVDII